MSKTSVSCSDERSNQSVISKPSKMFTVTEIADELDEIKVSEEPIGQSARIAGKNFNGLPRDVICMIFDILDSKNIALFVWPVCKTWYVIGHDPFLWKKITYMAKSYRRQPILFETDWVVKNCHLLESLTLKGCSFKSASAVRAVMSGCPHLKHLSLSDMQDSSLDEFAELKTLVSLELNYVRNLAVDFLPRISKNSNQLQRVIFRLYAFHLSERIFTDANVISFLTNLRDGLKSLYLTGSHFRCDTFQALTQCTNLRSIGLQTPSGFRDVDLKAMEKFKNLSDLTFSSVLGVSAGAWQSFVENVPSNRINSLHFEICPNLEPVMETVLSTRKDSIFYKAKSISLINFRRLTDRAISMILEGNSELHTLALFYCEGFTGIAFNISDTRIAPTLRCLEIRSPREPWKYLQTFKTNRPSLIIR